MATLGTLGWVGWSVSDFRDKDDRLSRFRDKDVATVVPGESAEAWASRAEGARKDRNDASERVTVSLLAPVPVATPDGLALAWRF